MTGGLRERWRQETRRAISAVAMELFEADGFDHVTISQVAAAAGVSKMTVTNHFPRKEDLVFDRAEESVRSLADAVSARDAGESLLAAVRRDYARRIAAGDVVLGPPTAAFARLVRDSPTLTARLRQLADQVERALGDAIAAETGVDDPQQRIVAAQLAAVHRVLFTDSAERIFAGQPADRIRRALAESAERAFELLEPSLGGYRVKP
jgi:AcrR family transcriptional regulator